MTFTFFPNLHYKRRFCLNKKIVKRLNYILAKKILEKINILWFKVVRQDLVHYFPTRERNNPHHNISFWSSPRSNLVPSCWERDGTKSRVGLEPRTKKLKCSRWERRILLKILSLQTNIQALWRVLSVWAKQNLFYVIMNESC